jgi:hypothetical protein
MQFYQQIFVRKSLTETEHLLQLWHYLMDYWNLIALQGYFLPLQVLKLFEQHHLQLPQNLGLMAG